MKRIQLHISEAQDRALRALARARRSTRADLIRQAIDRLLAEGSSERDALADLIGAAAPGPRSDLSENHDLYLYGAAPPLFMAAEPGSDD